MKSLLDAVAVESVSHFSDPKTCGGSSLIVIGGVNTCGVGGNDVILTFTKSLRVTLALSTAARSLLAWAAEPAEHSAMLKGMGMDTASSNRV